MKKREVTSYKFLKLVPLMFIIVIVLIGIFSERQVARDSNEKFDFFKTIIIGDIAFHEVLLLLLLGFLSGTVGGLLGMGGGVLKVANLHLIMGFDLLLTRMVSLLSYFVISVSAFLTYKKYNLILWNVVKMLIPSAILGVVIGAIIGNYIDPKYIEFLLGFYALFAGVIVLNQMYVKPFEKEIAKISQREISETAVSSIGIGMGAISSLIGISGGILSTPLQQSLLKLPLKNSIANTVTASIFCSFTASVFMLIVGLHVGNFLMSDVLAVTICMIPGNFIGGQFGGYLTKRLSLNVVRMVFAIVAFAIGFKILVL